MAKLQKKNFNAPDETRTPENTTIEVVTVGGKPVMKATFQPGWKWSEHIKPVAGGNSCSVHHFGYQVSGKMHIESDDGGVMETGPGDVADIPPGHNAWVIGSEPVVMIDFGSVEKYGK